MQKFLENKYLPFVVVGIFIFIRMSSVVLKGGNDDDAFHSTVLKSWVDVFPFISNYYFAWSSRVSGEFFSSLIMRENIWIWRSLNTGFFILLVFGIYRISALGFKEIGYKIRFLTVLGITFGVSFTNFNFYDWGPIIWVTGSFYYLWPTACMVMALYIPFKLLAGIDTPKKYALYYMPYLLYFGFTEQPLLVFLTFLTISMIIYYLRSHKISYTGLLLLLLSIAFLVFIITCPGNALRMKREIAVYYPAITDMAFSARIFHGISYTVFYNWISRDIFLLVPLYVIIIYLFFKYKKGIAWLIISFLALIYMISGAIFKMTNEVAFNTSIIYNFLVIANEKMVGAPLADSHISFYIGILILLFFPIAFYKIFGKTILFLEHFLLFGASVMSSAILSFSPTIFVSGTRIFFLGTVMLAMLVAKIFLQAIYKDERFNDIHS